MRACVSLLVSMSCVCRLTAIIEATGAGMYHGFLPSLVRDCVTVFTSTDNPHTLEASEFPLTFATALFSFLYHLATYEASESPPPPCVCVCVATMYEARESPPYACACVTSVPCPGGDALVNSGIMESLLLVLEWKAFEPMNITVSWQPSRSLDP